MRFSPFGWLNFVNIINKNLKTKQTILKEKTISLGLQKLWIFARRTEQNLPCIFSDTIKYMGCGACAYSQISDSKKPLHHRLLDKINTLKGKGHMGDMKSFISLQELKEIENATQPQRETIRLEELQRFQAGQTSLLSKQRRTAWKIAIYNQIKPGEMHPFSEHPTTNNQKTKNRFYEISLDVNRTFPLVKQLNRQHLTNVLQNITLNFQGIGYTQGMNFYTGFFLLCGFSKEEAYETFVRMSYNSHFLLIRNFSQNFKNVNCCVKIMDEVMKESKETVFYKIVDKIQSLGMNIFLFAFSWFLTYFLYNFNVKASILIWDYLLLFQPASKTGPNHPTSLKKQPSFGNGWVNSINLAIRILQSLSKQLLACNQISEMMNILRHDAIQAHLDEAKTEEIINKCRSEPLADMHLFREKCQQVDPQLLKIICDLQSPQSKSGEFVSFMNQCKVPKRSPEPAFQ